MTQSEYIKINYKIEDSLNLFAEGLFDTKLELK